MNVDLTFQEKKMAYLRRMLCQIAAQEETAETIIPDSMPDVGRIVGCWGVPVLRGKEWRSDGMLASGGITAKVLYVPADDGQPQVLESYLPFTMKWDFPMTDREGKLRVDCRLRSLDARMINSRKILLRANLAAKGEAYLPEEETFYTLQNPPKNVEVDVRHYPMILPVDCCEKSFLLDEELDLPGTAPEIAKVVYYNVQPELTDSKVMGSKAVFKGFAALHLLYLAPDGRLATWEYEIPFSQYAELEQEFEREEELQIGLMSTGVELDADEEGKRVRLKCSLLAQCLISTCQDVEVVQDAYSLRNALETKSKAVELESRLDRQQFQQVMRQNVPISGTVADASILPDYPRQERSGDTVRLEVPVSGTVVYYDDTGALQGKTVHGQANCEMKLSDTGKCYTDSASAGRVQCSAAGGNGELQASILVTVDCCAGQGMETLCGITLGDALPRQGQRPSVIVRKAPRTESLWNLAKTCGSTREAIQGANAMTEDHVEAGTLVLIPTL